MATIFPIYQGQQRVIRRRWPKYIISVWIAFILAVTVVTPVRSQVVIALLFGDKLNTPALKFGLEGGINLSTLTNVNTSKFSTGFNLGLYFDILLKKDKNWFIHTGVLLKSPMGGDNLTTYSLNDLALDSMFLSGHVQRMLRYINVPILIRYKLKCQLFFELGPMFGVLVKATDVFYNTISNKNDVSYKNNIYGKCNWFDAGAMGGFGYHFMKGTGLNLGVRYYYGFTNILAKGVSDPGQNNSLYIYLSIPIGAGEKSQAKAAEKAKEKAEIQQEKNVK